MLTNTAAFATLSLDPDLNQMQLMEPYHALTFTEHFPNNGICMIQVLQHRAHIDFCLRLASQLLLKDPGDKDSGLPNMKHIFYTV